MTGSDKLAEITVELFGTARMAGARRDLTIQVPAEASVGELVSVLARACPALVGIALREDLSGLLESYILNINGTAFVEDGRTGASRWRYPYALFEPGWRARG